MKARVLITGDGEFSIFIDEGDLEGGRKAINSLIAKLQAQGLKFKSVGVVEQHRHDGVAHTHKVAAS